MSKICNECGQDKCDCATGINLTEEAQVQRLKNDIIDLKNKLLERVTKPLNAKYGDNNYDIEKKQKRSEVKALKNSFKDKIHILDLIERGIEIDKGIVSKSQ